MSGEPQPEREPVGEPVVGIFRDRRMEAGLLTWIALLAALIRYWPMIRELLSDIAHLFSTYGRQLRQLGGEIAELFDREGRQ